MFTNQLPASIHASRLVPPPSTIPFIWNPEATFWPQDEGYGWGLGFLLRGKDLEKGRGRSVAEWGGLANSYYWVDRERGVAGVFSAQMFPYRGELVS